MLYNLLFPAYKCFKGEKKEIPFCIMLEDLCFISMTFQGIFSLYIAW